MYTILSESVYIMLMSCVRIQRTMTTTDLDLVLGLAASRKSIAAIDLCLGLHFQSISNRYYRQTTIYFTFFTIHFHYNTDGL